MVAGRVEFKVTAVPSECWAHAMKYLSPEDLFCSREVNKAWKHLSDSSTSWRLHCSNLWAGKQNMYLERWVNLDHCPEMVSFNHLSNNSKIKEQAFKLNQFYIKSSEAYDFARSSSDPEEFERIRDYLNRINDAIDRLLDFERLNAHMAEDSRMKTQRRQSMPASQYLLSRNIIPEQQLCLSYDSLSSEQFADSLREQILEALQTPLTISEADMKELEDKGVLLSWRDSYYASIRDSKRTWITHEVLPTLLICD